MFDPSDPSKSYEWDVDGRGISMLNPWFDITTCMAFSKPLYSSIYWSTCYTQALLIQLDDGQEVVLPAFICSHPDVDQLCGNPKKVHRQLMSSPVTSLINISEAKGIIVGFVIARNKPTMVLELGVPLLCFAVR